MNPSLEERPARITRFQKLCLEAGFQEVAPYVYELDSTHSHTLTLCTLIHGNEVGGMEVFLQLLEAIKSKQLRPQSKLRLMLGNVEAYYADKRYLESDLNRCFDLAEHHTLEERRAKEIEKFFADSDVLIDIHQTIGPTTTPFYIFEFEERSYNLARQLHSTLPFVTNTKPRPFKGKTSTAYALSKGKMAIAVETGQKGIQDVQISLGFELARRAVELDLGSPLPASALTKTYAFSQIIANPSGNLELIKTFNNFDPVKKGELLARMATQEVHCEVDGVILFPKYGDYARAAAELALILREIHSKSEL